MPVTLEECCTLDLALLRLVTVPSLIIALLEEQLFLQKRTIKYNSYHNHLLIDKNSGSAPIYLSGSEFKGNDSGNFTF